MDVHLLIGSIQLGLAIRIYLVTAWPSLSPNGRDRTPMPNASCPLSSSEWQGLLWFSLLLIHRGGSDGEVWKRWSFILITLALWELLPHLLMNIGDRALATVWCQEQRPEKGERRKWVGIHHAGCCSSLFMISPSPHQHWKRARMLFYRRGNWVLKG